MTVPTREPSRRRRLIIAGSFAAHGVALAAFVISGMWKIEKIDAAPTKDFNVSVINDAALSGGSPHPKDQEFKAKPPKQVPKQKIDQITQPMKMDTVPPRPTLVDSDDTGTGSGPPSDRIGDGGRCDNPPCGTDPHAVPAPLPTPPPPPAPPEVRVTEQTLSALRVAGETMIHPPQTDKIQMFEDHVAHTLGIFSICISETGSIDEVKKLRSTKYNGYDDKIIETMRTWRYRPYRAGDGRFSRACSTVTFSYTIQH